MTLSRGRPLTLRSGAEIVETLEGLLGFGRDRRHVLLVWNGHELELHTLPIESDVVLPLGKLVATGKSLPETVSRAMSQNAHRRKRS